MTARAVIGDIFWCAPSAPVVRAERGGVVLEALAATATGAVGNAVVTGLWRGCAGVGAVGAGEAEVASMLGSREMSKEYCGELGRVGTSKNPLLSVTSLV